MKNLKTYAWIALCCLFCVCLFTATSFASNNSPFLGDCVEYGIVCNYLNQTAGIKEEIIDLSIEG